jgi:hypothetical protein
MFSGISQSRLLVYVLLIGIIPILFVVIDFVSKQSQMTVLKNTLENVQQMAHLREKKQATNMAVRQAYQSADHFYIDKYLESLSLLENEVEALQKIANQSHIVDDEAVKKRLDYLNTNNRLTFSEGIVQSYPHFHETLETLVHAVEINEKDLEEILSKIEGQSIGPFSPSPNRPQLLITELKLDRKEIRNNSEVFLMNLKLLKREFF